MVKDFTGTVLAQAATKVNQEVDQYTVIGRNGVVVSAGGTDPTNAQLSLDITPTNGLTLMQGLPKAGSSLQLCSTGITLAVLVPGLGPTVAMSPTGIKVSVGPQAVLELTPTGVSLKYAAGAVAITVDATGVNLSVGASKVSLVAAASAQLSSTAVTLTGTTTIGGMVGQQIG